MLMLDMELDEKCESDFNIFYDDVLLNDVKYEKIFGITIDNCLSWCQQINNIVSKISSRLGLMCRLRTYLPTKGLIMRGKSFIYKRKSKGPGMLPCGIPYLIFCADDS
jgi:hypothetical protein